MLRFRQFVSITEEVQIVYIFLRKKFSIAKRYKLYHKEKDMKKLSPPLLRADGFGVYHIHWTSRKDGGSRSHRKSTSTTDLVQAKVFFGQWLRNDPIPDNGVTVNQILDAYLSGHVSENVIAKSRQFFCAKALRDFMGNIPMSGIRVAVEGYRKHRVLSVAQPTVRRELGMLRAAMNYCSLKTDLLKGVEIPHIPMPSHGSPKDVWLNEDESELLWKCAMESESKRGRVFTAIAMETAARKAVILNLKWDKVSLESGLINFAEDGKIQKGKRSGTVPMTNRLKAVMTEAFAEKDSEYVLGDPVRIEREFQKIIAAFVKVSGWKKAVITPHTLRHTWATLAARAGVDMWQIAGVLHDTLEVVAKTYAHHHPEHLRKAVNFREKRLENLAA